MERIHAPAPALPEVCSRDQKAPKRATLYVFTADWCQACEGWLVRLGALRDELARRGVDVRQVVTGEGDSCMAAARVAARAPFAYTYASSAAAYAWRVRSTPTSWLVNARGQTLLYVEGAPPGSRFLGAVDLSLGAPARGGS